MARNAFDELLASLDDNKRKAVEAAVAEVPDLRTGYLRQSDYSRTLDEHKEQLAYAAQMAEWQRKHLVQDPDRPGQWVMREVLELRSKVGGGGTAGEDGEMTVEQLQAALDAALAQRGYVDKATFDQTVAGYQQALEQKLAEQQATLASVVALPIEATRLALKHEKEFGEDLDVDGLFAYAKEKGHNNVRTAYEEMVAAKREERRQAEVKAQVDAAYNKGKQDAGMSAMGMPDDQTGATLSPLARRVFGADPTGAVDLDKLPFNGSGSIAAVAARTLPMVQGK